MDNVVLSDSTWLAKLAKLTLAIAGIALVCVALIEGWQVFARYVLNNSPSWTEPFALLSMSTAMMCGAAAGVRANRHFGFFMLAEHVAPSLRRVLQIIVLIIAVAVGAIFVIAGGHLVSESWDFPMAGAPLPQGVVYLPITIGGALIAVFAIERMVAMFQRADLQPTT
ncbi:MAG TPA: TRAP transporter small permease [Steroidobacteraceae bacterium]|nr:TRAP transporter small permease [Steroidobacteraceae bacterium]